MDVDGFSFDIFTPLFDSCPREGVCGLEEHLDDAEELKFSIGISSLFDVKTFGLPSRDLGVVECDRCFDNSRGLGVFIGTLDGFADNDLRLEFVEVSLFSGE
jgi:hypothetical protein